MGQGNFIRESGIGIQYVMHDPLVMFGTHPAFTGRCGQVVLGRKSGKASIESNLDIEGLSDDAIGETLGAVKKKGIRKKDILTDDEFLDIVRSVAGQVTAVYEVGSRPTR